MESSCYLQIVRIGHPARIVEAVQKYSLDALLSTADSAAIILDVRKDLQTAIVSTLYPTSRYCAKYCTLPKLSFDIPVVN